MNKVSELIKNYKYAPGIGTYGPVGKNGTDGLNGNSFFFCTYNISVDEELDIVNRKIQNNELLSEYKNLTLSRKYQEGDIIIDCRGSVYKLSILDPSTKEIGIERTSDKIGEFKFDSDTNFFELSSQGRLFNKKGQGIDFLRTSAENPANLLAPSNFVQRLYSDLMDADANYNMNSYVVQTENGIKTLNLFFNNDDKSFHIESDSPIILDCSIFAIQGNQEEYEDLDQYAKVESNQDNVSKMFNLYKQMSYSISSETLTIDTSLIKDYLNTDYRFNEIIAYVKTEDFKPIEKYSLKLPWSNGEAYSIGDSLDISLGTLTGVSSISVVRNIEVFLKNK